MEFTSASFLLSEQCNLRCKYCFELGKHNNSKMSNEVIIQSLNYLFHNAENQNIKHEDKYVHVILFGGEPLLNPDGVETLLKTAKELQEKTKIKFTSSLITNGTIMTPQIERIFTEYHKELNLMVQISLDGIKEAHDLNRVTADGKGTFDKILKNIEVWKRILNSDENPNKLCIHTCLSQSNMKYFFESWKFFMYEMKVPYIWFMPIHSDTYTIEDVKSYKRQLIQIAEVILNEAIIKRDLSPIKNYSPLDRSIHSDCGSFSVPCGAGKNFCTITSNGDIYPCHQIYYKDEEHSTKLGNIYTGVSKMKKKLYDDYNYTDLSCYQDNPECDCFDCYRCIADNWCRSKTLFTNVRGERCMMSHVERDVQHWIREELIRHNLINKENGGDNNE